jgi:hypothetical protein
MENQLHRRVREGEENDYEKGYHNNPVDAENSYPRNYKKNDTNKNVLFILFILLITIMAAGVYIDLKKMDNKKVSHSRKLTNHDVCIRTNYDTLTDYMKCITDSNKIVIISDKSEESIMTDFLYKDYDMGYRHLRDIFHDVNDLFTFYEVFGLFRLAVIIQQIWARYRAGQTTNPAFAGFGDAVNTLINRAEGKIA